MSGGPTASFCEQKLTVLLQTRHGKPRACQHLWVNREVTPSCKLGRWTQSRVDGASPLASSLTSSLTVSVHGAHFFDARNGPTQPAHSKADNSAAVAAMDVRAVDECVIKRRVLQ
jgi:hypothetical protein